MIASRRGQAGSSRTKPQTPNPPPGPPRPAHCLEPAVLPCLRPAPVSDCRHDWSLTTSLFQIYDIWRVYSSSINKSHPAAYSTPHP